MLIDTNIISELCRQQPNAGVLRWASSHKTVHISVITLDELIFGLTAKQNPKISRWIDEFIHAHCIVLPITEQISRYAGQLRGALRTQGMVRHQADMLIAATASLHSLTLVTRDTKDFEHCAVFTC